jgi:hypothetical protein
MIREMATDRHHSEVSVRPRWPWPVWGGAMIALLVALGLWVVQGVLRGVPGPVIQGVYVDGAVDSVVVVVTVLATTVLSTLATILVSRAPGNRIGRILWLIAAWMVTTFFLIISLYFLHSPTSKETAFANWLGTWSFVLFVPTSLVLMIFPSGRLPSPRWSLLPWLAVLGTLGWAATEAFGERLGLEGELPNPYANASLERIGGIVVLLFLPALIGTVASLVVRYRHASPEVRAQIKWVAVGGILQIVVIFGLWVLDVTSSDEYPIAGVLAGTVSLLFVPVGLAVAILRYHLYDIDHLVSRTVSYTVLGGLLGALFFVGVLGAQVVFDATSDLAVAATTLAVAAIFDPLRRRLHGVMDRRFNRSRFDAERVVEAFTTRMSAMTSPEALSSDIAGTVEATLAPEAFGIWIRNS